MAGAQKFELPERLKPKRRFGNAGLIRAARPVDLESLRDVRREAGDPDDGDVLRFNATTKKWEASPDSAGMSGVDGGLY